MLPDIVILTMLPDYVHPDSFTWIPGTFDLIVSPWQPIVHRHNLSRHSPRTLGPSHP